MEARRRVTLSADYLSDFKVLKNRPPPAAPPCCRRAGKAAVE